MKRHFAWLIGLLLLLSTTSSFGQKSYRKTLWKNGFYAATYGELAADKGDLFGYNLSLMRFSFGAQLLRWEDYFSLTVGYQKSGFYDALKNHDTGNDDFQIDYHGLITDLHFFPRFWINGGLRYHINNQGKASERITAASEANGADVRYRYNFEISEVSLHLAVKVWQRFAITLGAGQRSIDFSYKITQNADTVEIAGETAERAKAAPASGSFFMLGIKGSLL